MFRKLVLGFLFSFVLTLFLQESAFAGTNDCFAMDTDNGFQCGYGSGFKVSGRDIFGDVVYEGYGIFSFLKMSQQQYSYFLTSKGSRMGYKYQDFDTTPEDVCKYAICAASPSNKNTTNSSSTYSRNRSLLSNYGKLSPVIQRSTSVKKRNICEYFVCLSQYQPKRNPVVVAKPQIVVTTPKPVTTSKPVVTTTTTLPKDISDKPIWVDTAIEMKNLKYEADCSIAYVTVYPPKASDRYGIQYINMRVSWAELPIYNFFGNMEKAELYGIPRDPQPKLIFKAVDIHGFESTEYIYDIPDNCPYKESEEPDLFIGPVSNNGPIATQGPEISGYKGPFRPRATVYAKLDCRNCGEDDINAPTDWIQEYYFVLQSVNGGPENTCESGWRITIPTWGVEASCDIYISGAPSGEYYLTIVATTENGVTNSVRSEVTLDPSY